MLNSNQFSDLDAAKSDLESKQIILKTGIDVQALLRILVDKEIITREEINKYREEVSSSPKYANALKYVEQTLEEIKYYETHPQERLQEMFRRKMQEK